MKQFACGSVVAGCAELLEAETDDELIQEAAVHGREAHGMNEMTPQLAKQVRENIRDA